MQDGKGITGQFSIAITKHIVFLKTIKLLQQTMRKHKISK